MAKKKAKKEVATVINPETGNKITLTPEIIEKAELAYRLGIMDVAVANYIGVNPSLFREWLTKGALFGTGLHGELFKRCSQATAMTQMEWVNELRKHAFGADRVFAYNETTYPDGRVVKTVATDAEGKPIVLKEEVKGNPTWIAWLLERRYRKSFGKQEEGIPECILDTVQVDAALNDKEQPIEDGEKNVSILNNDERIKILQTALEYEKVKASDNEFES